MFYEEIERMKINFLQQVAKQGHDLNHASNWFIEADLNQTIEELIEEYNTTSPNPILSPGTEITVKAWWSKPKGQPCKCRVIKEPWLNLNHKNDHPYQ